MKKYKEEEEELSATLGMDIFDPSTEPVNLLARCADFCEEMLDLYADDPAYEPEYRAFMTLMVAIAIAGVKYEVLRLMTAGAGKEDVLRALRSVGEKARGEIDHAAQ